MTITIVVAAAENDVIGTTGASDGMPWRIKTDMRHFRDITIGHPVIVGRTTHDIIGTLPGRQNIVMTRDVSYKANGVVVIHDVDAAIAAAESDSICVIGGGKIYEAFLPRTDAIELTRVHASPEGTARFTFDKREWKLVNEEAYPASADTDDEYAFTFQRWERP
jgi:dihydrofolate reductase